MVTGCSANRRTMRVNMEKIPSTVSALDRAWFSPPCVRSFKTEKVTLHALSAAARKGRWTSAAMIIERTNIMKPTTTVPRLSLNLASASASEASSSSPSPSSASKSSSETAAGSSSPFFPFLSLSFFFLLEDLLFLLDLPELSPPPAEDSAPGSAMRSRCARGRPGMKR